MNNSYAWILSHLLKRTNTYASVTANPARSWASSSSEKHNSSGS
jgi:hypothetical protein